MKSTQKTKNTTLYYIHGYQSSPTSTKAVLFQNKLKAKPITYRKCPPEKLKIKNCLQQIAATIQNDSNTTLIGSSLGGYLAAKTAQKNQQVKKLILLNPAIIPPNTDITKHTDVPKNILRDMIDETLFEIKLNCPITIIRGTNDTVIPDEWILSFAQKQEATVIFLQDDHRFSQKILQLPNIITKIITC